MCNLGGGTDVYLLKRIRDQDAATFKLVSG